MRLYSDFAWHRARQICADVVATATLWGIVRMARGIGDRINDLKRFGEQMESAGAELGGRLTDAGQTLGSVPLVGDSIREPFDAAARGAFQLQQAGLDQQHAVGEFAVTVAVASAALPVLAVLLVWLVPRVRFVVRAHRAARLAASKDAIDLLALRALLTTAPATLLEAVPNAADRWRDGDKAALRKLAALELRRSGVALRHGGKKGRAAAL